MGMMKHEHHEEIVRNSRTTKTERNGLEAAEEEHYAEQKRHRENKRKFEEKNIPIAAPVFPQFEGRRSYPADPATDTKRFEQVCREAEVEAKRTGDNIVVFKNREGNYFTWEEKYISVANPIEVLYTAQA